MRVQDSAKTLNGPNTRTGPILDSNHIGPGIVLAVQCQPVNKLVDILCVVEEGPDLREAVPEMLVCAAKCLENGFEVQPPLTLVQNKTMPVVDRNMGHCLDPRVHPGCEHSGTGHQYVEQHPNATPKPQPLLSSTLGSGMRRWEGHKRPCPSSEAALSSSHIMSHRNRIVSGFRKCVRCATIWPPFSSTNIVSLNCPVSRPRVSRRRVQHGRVRRGDQAPTPDRGSVARPIPSATSV